ncbi:MAG: hypothetical protein ACJ8F3_03690 [Xanthobacteraceae bacterium]
MGATACSGNIPLIERGLATFVPFARETSEQCKVDEEEDEDEGWSYEEEDEEG